MLLLVCLALFFTDVTRGEDNCDETCEQIKFDKVKTATQDLRETAKAMEAKIDSLENMLELLEDERKWTLALKVEAGSHICVHCAWSNPAAVNPQTYLQAIDLKKPCGCAFVNHDVLTNWTQLFQSKMTQVSISFWNRTSDDVSRVASALFDGRDSTSASWFHEDRLRDSSFDDLKAVKKEAVDEKLGQAASQRGRKFLQEGERISFAMGASDPYSCDQASSPSSSSTSSSSSNSSQAARGWMMVAQRTPHCVASDYELARISGAISGEFDTGALLPPAPKLRFPAFLYVEDSGAGEWSGAHVRAADVMTIFVR